MDFWDKSFVEDRYEHRRGNPSFSSTLLDAIYRSIDGGAGEEGEERLYFYRATMRKKQSTEEEMANFRRACMIEKWMEKKASEKVGSRRNSMADFDRKARNVRDRGRDRDVKLVNSSSTSSESSCGGGFSSSESESFRGSRSRQSHVQGLKSIRTSAKQTQFDEAHYSVQTQKPKHENGFVKTKSKALKIYGDLKRVKQPISPGGKLASFLNSLFNGGSPKRAKFPNHEEDCSGKSKSAQGSTCSSASSFSRSCLSKTPSSGGKSNNGSAKRSVRFCPVNVILNESFQEQPLGIMSMATLKNNLTNNNAPYRAEEVAGQLLCGYQRKEKADIEGRHERSIGLSGNHEDEEEDEDDDDAMSCSSSDLFELDNLSAIGIERYREELPVYETTHFTKNRAISNGLIL